MPALVDARPAGIDLLFRPGTTLTVVLTWPSGALTGRTFTSTLNGAALSVSVVGDDLTIEATDTQTAATSAAAEWSLIEDGEPILVGTWAPSDSPAARSQQTVSVTQGTVQVDVAALVNVGLTSHVNAHQGRGVHGVVTHDWTRDGWDLFTPVVITADDPQSFTQTASNGRGVLTATAAADGNLRVAYLRDDTTWRDSEITSLVWGPAAYATSPLNAQQGHIHRVREIAPGIYEGIAVWTAVVGGDYATLNTRAVRWEGTTLSQSAGDLATSADLSFFDRRVSIVSKERTTGFGLFFNNLSAYPKHLYGIAAGDTVTISSSDATFNETNIAVNGADSDGVVQTIETTTLSTSPLAVDRGYVMPSGTSGQKRWTPYWLSTRVRGGTSSALVVEFKRWRPEEGEPDWGDSRVQRRNVTTNAGVPTIPTEAGACALWGAHFSSSSSGTWGEVTFREL